MNSPDETDIGDPEASGAWFCARCDRAVSAIGPGSQPDRPPLCPRCGDRLERQGYCPVCRGSWRRAVATYCPKHDVPLESGPPRDTGEGDAPRAAWTTVAVFARPADAEAPRLRLEAEGIPTFLDGERAGALQHPALSAVRLQVPRDLLADARILLAQSWSAVAPGEDLDETGEQLEPDPAARRKDVIRLLILTWLLASLTYLVGTGLLALLG